LNSTRLNIKMLFRILNPTCPNSFLSRRQYELSRMFSVFSLVKFFSCMDNATSYQTACCGVIYNVAILHWLNIISYAYHHDMFVNYICVIIMNKTLYYLYIKTTKEDKPKCMQCTCPEKCDQTKPKLYVIHISGYCIYNISCIGRDVRKSNIDIYCNFMSSHEKTNYYLHQWLLIVKSYNVDILLQQICTMSI
jgi:hypothetical protein